MMKRRHPPNCDCDLCMALSHTDLAEVPEPRLVLVPITALREMQRIIHAPHMPTDSDQTLDRFASLATILDAFMPDEGAT